jgi:DNA-binding MarR family transcriptional regulator
MTAAQRWLDASEQEAWRSFVQAYGRLVNELDRDLATRSNMTLAEYEVLVHLSEAPDWSMRMNELAELCSLSPSGLTRRFDSMARQGHVRRERCDDDRRGVNAVLTDAGFERLRSAAPVHVRGVKELFIDSIEPSELEQFTAVLKKIAVQKRRRVTVIRENHATIVAL